jgi:hypothetical protein
VIHRNRLTDLGCTFQDVELHPDLRLARLRSWFEGLSGGSWILVQSVLAVAAVAAGDVIVNLLSQDQSWTTRILLVATLVIGAIVYFWISLAASRVRDRVFPKHPATVLALQRELDDALASENQLLDDGGGRTRRQKHVEGVAIFMRAVQRALTQQWSEPRFGSGTQTEVVLMLKSLRDNAMTCGAWAVRKPYSLGQRENDPTVYDETEAARMYRAAESGRVGTRLIADTGQRESHYVFLNKTENDRIRSTVLHPVYDPRSELVGVIVAHTNRPNVFRPEDSDFWTALFRLVEPHVARRIILARTESWANDPPW